MKNLIVNLFPDYLKPYVSSAIGDFGLNLKCLIELGIDIIASFAFTHTATVVLQAQINIVGEVFHSVTTIVSGLILAFLVYFGQKVYFPYLVGRFKDKYPKYKLYDDDKK